MSSDAEIVAQRASLGHDVPVPKDPRRWAALVVMLLAAFMNLLDVSIVNIAIPSIQRGLHASYADVQWTLAGYEPIASLISGLDAHGLSSCSSMSGQRSSSAST